MGCHLGFVHWENSQYPKFAQVDIILSFMNKYQTKWEFKDIFLLDVPFWSAVGDCALNNPETVSPAGH